ncbi:PAAR domain-containing protein [Moraxella bovis]|uniref:PAAR domain-containing protein n=1 Tax=Moraxella bovis TaxID=476 RepID=UPI00222717D9|nr:PAAR domain-containing protein [Moraxella bovis]UYZ89111.1 PAAR domain-containing protein [Moraxella bovis]UZA13881.1 PAAR domain-containing protein [Moraxella bovis]
MTIRYYILEGDTTTAGGIVQKTTNTLSFKVYGKEQSYIGDDVWCPACQSMGKIIPDQDRLSTKVNGRMPALNDDLCLCKCNPPPKLVHSQTSFKEVIENNSNRTINNEALIQKDNFIIDDNYQLQFQCIDSVSGFPIFGIYYIAVSNTGTILKGLTDKCGLTEVLTKDKEETFEIHFFEEVIL